MKGKLAEEVVKLRLGNLVNAVDYETKIGGDGKIDFTLTSVPEIGIQVKSRHGDIDTVTWSISKEEIEKNAVLVCVLIQEEVSEAQPQYHLVIAGFLPTDMINLTKGKVSLRIDELLYSGNLKGYLEHWIFYKINEYIHMGDEYFNKSCYQEAIAYYDKALDINPKLAKIYNSRGMAYYNIGNKNDAIRDYTQSIKIDPNFAITYFNRGLVYDDLGDENNAIKDYTQAIKIDNYYADAYNNRGCNYYNLGDNDNALKDYTQAIKISQNDADLYFNRAVVYDDLGDKDNAIMDYRQTIKLASNYAKAYYYMGLAYNDLGNKESAIRDLTTSAYIYKKQGKTEEYQEVIDEIIKIKRNSK